MSRLLTLLSPRSNTGKTPDQAATAVKRWFKNQATYQDTPGVTPAAADGDVIGEWQDVSGNGGKFTQSTTANKPVLKTGSNGINGLSVVQFDGSNDVLTGTVAISNIITPSAYTYFVVLKASAITANNATSYLNDGVIVDTGAYMGLFLRNTGGGLAYNYNWDGNEDKASAAFSTATAHVVMCRHEGGNVYLSIDGGAEQSAASGNTANVGNMFQIGKSAGGVCFTGQLAEIAIWDVALGTQDIADLITGFKYKWGVA